MTCVVGIVDRDRTVLAADSGVSDTDNGSMSRMSIPKVMEIAGVVVGLSGDVADLAALQFMEIESGKHYRKGHDLLKWIMDTFLPAWRKSADGINPGNKIDSTVIIGAYGLLYELPGGMAYTWVDHTYMAIGSGMSVATGALHALTSAFDWNPKHRIEQMAEMAVQAAIDHVPYIMGPIITVSK